MVEPTPEQREAAQSFVRANTSLNTGPLAEALRGAYGDSYALGALSGAEQTGATVVAGLDGVAVPSDFDAMWAAWEPGNLNAAVKVSEDGLSGLISGISDTTLDQFGSIISEGLLNGLSVDAIAGQLGDYLDDPNRAFAIANTEVSSAVTQASLQQFTAQGVTQFELITSPDACETCTDAEADNPHDLDDTDATPPLHVNCRCAASPVDSSGDEVDDDDVDLDDGDG